MAQADYRPLRNEYRHFNYKGYRRGRLRHNGYRAVEEPCLSGSETNSCRPEPRRYDVWSCAAMRILLRIHFLKIFFNLRINLRFFSYIFTDTVVKHNS